MPRSRLAALAGAIIAATTIACYAPVVSRERNYHPSDADLTVTRIVHGTVILDWGATKILVDPWFSPSPPFGPREPIGIALDKLPEMRGIVVTHRHSDHFDAQTLVDYPNKSLRVVTVRGLGPEIREMGYDDVVEVEAWEETQIGDVLLTATPALHDAPEVGFVFRREGVVAYLAGDTRFQGREFRQIAKAFPSIDVALLPVGGIRIFGGLLDMTAEQAARAIRLLGAKRAIPYHYGLTGPFPFVLSGGEAAPRELATLLEQSGKKRQRNRVVILEPGESWHHYR